MKFSLTCLTLSPGLIFATLGQLVFAAPFGLALLAWMLTVAKKKRSLMGPVNYVAVHVGYLLGLAAGLFFNRLPAPEAYPRNAIEYSHAESLPTRVTAIEQHPLWQS